MDEKKILEALKIIGNNIRTIRESRGITIKDLSQKTEITERRLTRIEQGIAKRFNAIDISDIACVLDVRPCELCKGI